MAQIISIVSGKGGVGKSTICVGIADALAEQGKKVLVLELSFGMRVLDVMLGVENDAAYDIGDVLTEVCDISTAAITSANNKNLDVIVATPNPTLYNERALANLCKDIRSLYDFVIIDNLSGVGETVLASVSFSDLVLFATIPEFISVRGTAMFAELLEDYLKRCRLIINKADSFSLKSSEITDLDDVIDRVGVQLLGAIPDDKMFEDNFSVGKSLPPNSLQKKIFDSIARRILGEYIPLNIK